MSAAASAALGSWLCPFGHTTTPHASEPRRRECSPCGHSYAGGEIRWEPPASFTVHGGTAPQQQELGL